MTIVGNLDVLEDGGRIVSDSGLRAVGALEKPVRVFADLAQRLPDPRSSKLIEHSADRRSVGKS